MRKTFKILIGIAIVLAVLILGGFILKWILSSGVFQNTTVNVTVNTLNIPNWLESPLSILFGGETLQSVESLILAIAVFGILLFALADLIGAFSSFNTVTTWVIAVGLAIIASITRVVSATVAWFGITAGIGALGIGLIIIWAIVIGVIMNFIIGWSGIKEARDAKQSQAKINTAVGKMRKGFGLLKGGSDIVDENDN